MDRARSSPRAPGNFIAPSREVVSTELETARPRAKVVGFLRLRHCTTPNRRRANSGAGTYSPSGGTGSTVRWNLSVRRRGPLVNNNTPSVRAFPEGRLGQFGLASHARERSAWYFRDVLLSTKRNALPVS